jgi:acyl-CoA reductase-like NAD-dependent aldehyde dehydrogenase
MRCSRSADTAQVLQAVRVAAHDVEREPRQIDAARAAGATVALGGKRINRPGFYIEPTILTDIARDNPAFSHEFFGPRIVLRRR